MLQPTEGQSQTSSLVQFSMQLRQISTEFGFTDDTCEFLQTLLPQVFPRGSFPTNKLFKLSGLAKAWCCALLRLSDPITSDCGDSFSGPGVFSALCVYMRQLSDRYLAIDFMREHLFDFSQRKDRTILNLDGQNLGAVWQDYILLVKSMSDNPSQIELLKQKIRDGSLTVGSKKVILLISIEDGGWQLCGVTFQNEIFDERLSADQCPLLFAPNIDIRAVQNNMRIMWQLLNVLGHMSGLEPLLAYLSRDDQLKELSLVGNPLGDMGITTLAEILQGHPQLTYLNVSNTDFGTEGANALLELLKKTPSLAKIDFQGNHGISANVSEAINIMLNIRHGVLALQTINALQSEQKRLELQNKIHDYQYSCLPISQRQADAVADAEYLPEAMQAQEWEELKENLFGSLEDYWKERGGLETPGYQRDRLWLQDLCDQTSAGPGKLNAELLQKRLEQNKLKINQLNDRVTQIREQVSAQEQTLAAWELIFGRSLGFRAAEHRAAYQLPAWQPLLWVQPLLGDQVSRYQQDIESLLEEEKHSAAEKDPNTIALKALQARRFVLQYTYQIESNRELMSLSDNYEQALTHFVEHKHQFMLRLGQLTDAKTSHHQATFNSLNVARNKILRELPYKDARAISHLEQQSNIYERHLSTHIENVSDSVSWASYHAQGASHCDLLKETLLSMLLHPSLYVSAKSQIEQYLFQFLLFAAYESQFHRHNLKHYQKIELDALARESKKELLTKFFIPPSKLNQISAATQQLHAIICDEALTEDDATFTEDMQNRLKLTLSQWADINGVNTSPSAWQGDLPLHTAFVKGNKALIRFLIDQGADITLRDPRKNETPIERLRRVVFPDRQQEILDWLSAEYPAMRELIQELSAPKLGMR
ncbi:MAG: hypothetical protein K0Q74_721 [Gammaproteobacteria bacterium]|jgi:hypothetical protein|nr:hypothetical protein [Gammaproteobacteria bacterium]